MPAKRTTRAPARVASATTLKKLQETLNRNKGMRAAFIKDPGAVLRAKGVQIGADKERQIAQYLGKMTAPQRSAFEAQLVRIRVGVRVRIRIRVNIGITL